MTLSVTNDAQTLTSEALRVEVLPEFGAKISSLRTLPDGEELLQKPLRPYAVRSREMAFEDGDASGIDECIPTVSACEISGAGGKRPLPDHGDFWRIPFTWRREAEDLVLDATGFSLPLRFEKRLRLEGTRLSLAYRLDNIGSETVPFLWSAHPGFAVEAGDGIVLPGSVREVTVWHSGNSRLGEPGRAHPWPYTFDGDGRAIDLSVAGAAGDGVGDKIFSVSPREGWIALDRRRLQRRIEVRFDPEQIPYVGFWLAYGGWPEGSGVRQHCVALEPCTAPADSLDTAIARNLARTLAPGAIWEWKIEIHVTPA